MTLQSFRDGNLQLLVASDVAARGLDIPDVSHVFNFDVPIHSEDYVHRIGRTGRAGRSGAAFTLVTKRDSKFVDAIEKLIGEKVEWLNGDVNSLPPAEESADSERPRRNSRERGAKGERGDRDRGRGRGNRSGAGHKFDNDIQDNDVQVIQAAPVKADIVKHERKAEQKPQNNARNSRPYPANDDSRDRRRHRDHDDGPTPVGFGDDIPAFMLIAGSAKV